MKQDIFKKYDAATALTAGGMNLADALRKVHLGPNNYYRIKNGQRVRPPSATGTISDMNGNNSTEFITVPTKRSYKHKTATQRPLAIAIYDFDTLTRLLA